MGFEDLTVWKKGARLSAAIYKELAGLRDFGFRDQVTRSGLSIPSNIAEGMERRTWKDRNRFLEMARGSCAELRTQLYIGLAIGYIGGEVGKRWIRETREISAMLVGLSQNRGSENK